MDSHSPLLMTMRGSLLCNLPRWQQRWLCCGSITNMELFLVMGLKTQSVLFFVFINPSVHLQLTRFFFWLRQPDSNKVLLAYVFHCDAEYPNSKWSEKGSSISCPFCIPTAMRLS